MEAMATERVFDIIIPEAALEDAAEDPEARAERLGGVLSKSGGYIRHIPCPACGRADAYMPVHGVFIICPHKSCRYVGPAGETAGGPTIH